MLGILHQRVLDSVGRAVIQGRLAAGDVMLLDALAQEQGVSRPVAREAVRVLQSLGLVETVKRVGVRVLPLERWNVLDPAVIHWRLEAAGSLQQLRSLTELRAAVEPMAAGLAASAASSSQSAELVSLAGSMRAAAGSGDIAGFLRDDVLFHQLLLRSCGNEMFARLGGVVGEVLRGHTLHDATPEGPDAVSLRLHLEVADAVRGGRAEEATEAMSAIASKTLSEIVALVGDRRPSAV